VSGTASPARGGWPGSSAPTACAARGPGRLYQALRGGRFVLLAPPDDHAAADPWAGRVDLAAPAEETGTATLGRPDDYVAWASVQLC
jgi:hypothetical protein